MMFILVGGPAYGPPALANTTRVDEKHTLLASFSSVHRQLWHSSVRNLYAAARPKPPLLWLDDGDAARLHISAHVRRGDVGLGFSGSRYLSNGDVAVCIVGVLSTLQRARRDSGRVPPTVHILSQGERSSFDPLQKLPRVRFHLNAPLAATFHSMVMADVLILASSTLSEVAAFLAAGRLEVQLFAHPRAAGLLKYVRRGLPIQDCTSYNAG